MPEVCINYSKGVEFRAVARGHELICDQPPENGGVDGGMTPPELLLASIGTCAGFYAVQYLKTRSLEVDGLSVKVTAEKSTTRPVRLEKFRISVDAPFVSEDHLVGLHRAVEACLIHKTLAAPSEMSIEISTSPVVAHVGCL